MSDESTPAAPPSGPVPVSVPAPQRREAPASNGAGTEKYKERGVFLRVFVYVFATHLFAGFIWILFYVGGHRH